MVDGLAKLVGEDILKKFKEKVGKPCNSFKVDDIWYFKVNGFDRRLLDILINSHAVETVGNYRVMGEKGIEVPKDFVSSRAKAPTIYYRATSQELNDYLSSN